MRLIAALLASHAALAAVSDGWSDDFTCVLVERDEYLW